MTPSDTLIDNYRAAQKLQDGAGPSELTRQRILAHAEQLANNKLSSDPIISPEIVQNDTNFIANKSINAQAANDSEWKIRALASIAVFGIAGLLMLQFYKDAPKEFLPTTKPQVAAERSDATALPERESKRTADTFVHAPAAAPPAPAAPSAMTAPAAAKPAPKLDSQLDPLLDPSLTKNAKKSEAPSRNDLEAAAPKSEAMSERAAEVAPPPKPSIASAPPAAVASAPAAAPAPAVSTMADSANLSRSAPMASRATAKETTTANTKLFNAIQTKDAAALKLALESGDDKNAKNTNGTPALSLCVQSEQLNLVQLLIGAGADINALDARGVSPLTHARNRGFTDIVNILLNSGAK